MVFVSSGWEMAGHSEIAAPARGLTAYRDGRLRGRPAQGVKAYGSRFEIDLG